ncbi:MAG: GDP-mannose 4,6-dehydratase [Chloroflexota bacterium]
MRALVTGISGFAGLHLANHLRARPGLEVFGVVRRERSDPPRETYAADLCDDQAVRHLVEDIRPDLVFHLAAQAAVQVSWAKPRDTLVNNLVGELNLIQAILSVGLSPRMLVVGSADEYGLVSPDELPVRETNELRPNSPYAVSKVAQDMLAYQYFLSHRLPIVRVRPFNHIGPGQSDLFASASFARQIAEIELGRREGVLLVGNLEAKRDFTDVRDIVRGYSLLLERGVPGEVYNLGSGRSVSVRYILDTLLAHSRAEIRVETDPSRLRPSDVPELVCDYGKAAAATGWQPAIPLERTLKDLLNYWRERLSCGGEN